MVLGHEGSGIVVKVGDGVKNLKKGIWAFETHSMQILPYWKICMYLWVFRMFSKINPKIAKAEENIPHI